MHDVELVQAPMQLCECAHVAREAPPTAASVGSHRRAFDQLEDERVVADLVHTRDRKAAFANTFHQGRLVGGAAAATEDAPVAEVGERRGASLHAARVGSW